MDKKETATITFRIDEENSQALRKVAEEREISLNTLANQIFGSTLQLDYPMSKFGVVMMSKLAFKTLLTNLNDKDIIKLGSDIGFKEPKEFILFKWNKINTEIVLHFIKIYFEHCGYGRCNTDQFEKTNTFSIHHDLGKKGSLYLEAFLKSMIESTLEKPCKTITTDNTITMELTQ